MSILNETYVHPRQRRDDPEARARHLVHQRRPGADTVRAAIELGYRNIDTAQAYGNEHGVGEGVRSSGVRRDELFVSTKLAAEIKDHDRAVAAIEESLATLGLDHVDLMLIHAPSATSTPRTTASTPSSPSTAASDVTP
ncbi:aldo/keto reductase [Nocardioides jishulii]|uniref:aldo/keto reductase n=1 Tax=Nocardioides jishulii TaxID=2575440 RepID=UPI001EEFEAA2|nr:aldo/keto reductase [Nocardioides jishulii]